MGSRVKEVEKWQRRIKRQGFFFISIGWYILSFSKSCFGHADEKKKEKGGTKRVRARITGRPGKLRHTPRCSGIHQVSPATTQSAKPLTIPILPSKNLSSTNAPTRPQTPGPMFCHRARVQSRSFVRSLPTIQLCRWPRCLVAFLTNWGDEGSLVTRFENKFVRAGSLMDRVPFQFPSFASPPPPPLRTSLERPPINRANISSFFSRERSKDSSFPNFEFLNSNHPRDTPRFLHRSFFKISAGQDPVEIDYRRTGESVDFAPLEDPFLVYLHGEKEKDV